MIDRPVARDRAAPRKRPAKKRRWETPLPFDRHDPRQTSLELDPEEKPAAETTGEANNPDEEI